jgi:predicted transposase/invertase (TIGR01784 family)
MSFDSTCRRLAEQFPQDFASWLLGREVVFTILEPTELSLEPIRADSLILLAGNGEILHIEFQVDPKPDMAMRLADYRLRIYRKFPNHTIHQVVIYLRETTSDRVYQNYFEIAGMYAEHEVIRIWEVPATELQNYPGLLPFAVLGQTPDPVQTLRDSVHTMGTLPTEQQQHEALGAAYILSGLKLDSATIAQIIRRDVMQESVTYQALLEEGRQEGIREGFSEAQRSIALSLLHEQLSDDLIQRVSGLSIEEIAQLRLTM